MHVFQLLNPWLAFIPGLGEVNVVVQYIEFVYSGFHVFCWCSCAINKIIVMDALNQMVTCMPFCDVFCWSLGIRIANIRWVIPNFVDKEFSWLGGESHGRWVSTRQMSTYKLCMNRRNSCFAPFWCDTYNSVEMVGFTFVP